MPPTASPLAHFALRPVRRNLLVVATALLIAFVFSQTNFFTRLDLELFDQQTLLLSSPQDMTGVVGIDIDEKSMDLLEAQLGAWPYNRDVFALVTNFLREAGTATIAYDIVFSESRKGDADFAKAIQRAGKVVLPATANSAYPFERSAGYDTRLARLAWSRELGIPHASRPDITLPLESLSVFADHRVSVGVIAVDRDPDGILRRVALFHESRGYLLPSHPLATLFAGAATPPIEYDGRRGRVKVATWEFPVNDDGETLLQFSRPTEPVVFVPFYQVVLAALDAPGAAQVRAQFAGKKVFIGSTAAKLNDYGNTPIGVVPGLQILMQAHAMLDQGRVLKPPSAGWNALLTLVALAVPLVVFHRSKRMHPMAGTVSALFTIGLVFLFSALLLADRQAVMPLFPLTAGLIAHLLLSLTRLYELYQERQRLAFEKMAAEAASRLKSQFMSHMTHELRTPLTAILGFNRLISAGHPDDLERCHYQELVEKNGRHLLTLINNILDAARIEAGQMKITPEPTAIREVLRDVIDTLSPLATEKGLKFSANTAEDLPQFVLVDGLRVRQVLINLAGNGIKFTSSGQVTVDVRWGDDTLRIIVSDTGPGISQAALEHVFEPFDQGDASAARRLGGSGLGLAISRNLCQLMGGSLTAESRIGRGTRFTATLHAPASEPRPKGVATLAKITGQLSGKVLLVDDNPDARDLITLLLTRLGIEVLEAEDGAAAINIALREKPDLVLMDMEMPVMSGFEATRGLRAGGYRLPILAVTAHTGEHELELIRAAGCDGQIAKPVDGETLLQALSLRLPARAADQGNNAALPRVQ